MTFRICSVSPSVPPVKYTVVPQNDHKTFDFSFPFVQLPTPKLSATPEQIQIMNQQLMQKERERSLNFYAIKNLKIAQDYAKKGDYSQALTFIGDVLQQEPNHYRALTDQASILWLQGNLNDALACLDHSIRFYPDQYIAYFLKGAILLQQHRHLEAVENFNIGFVHQRPEHISFALNCFMFLQCKISFNAVKETTLFYIENSRWLYPDHEDDLLMLRALFYASQDDFVSARLDIEVACRKNPHNQLAAALKTLIWQKATTEPTIPNSPTTPLQQGRVPIEVLLNQQLGADEC